MLRVLEISKVHGQTHAKFSNKTPFRSITANKVFEWVQIVLLKMQTVIYKNKSFRYILTVVDVFSRFSFMKAIERKTSKEVAASLKDIFSEHVSRNSTIG